MNFNIRAQPTLARLYVSDFKPAIRAHIMTIFLFLTIHDMLELFFWQIPTRETGQWNSEFCCRWINKWNKSDYLHSVSSCRIRPDSLHIFSSTTTTFWETSAFCHMRSGECQFAETGNDFWLQKIQAFHHIRVVCRLFRCDLTFYPLQQQERERTKNSDGMLLKLKFPSMEDYMVWNMLKL